MGLIDATIEKPQARYSGPRAALARRWAGGALHSAASPRRRRVVPVAAAAGAQEARAKLMSLTWAFVQSQAVYSAARLGVADALAGGPLPVAELAEAVGAKEDYLRRVLRLLVALGVFREERPGVFANNAESDLLRRDAPGSAVDTVLHWGDESYLGHSHMYDGMLASHPSIGFHDVSGGLSYWEWMNLPENKERSERFDRAMTSSSGAALPALMQGYNWGQHSGRTLMDVGGGVGGVLSAILHQVPSMRGVLFERPSVIETAKELWPKRHAELLPRAELVAGDFFSDSLPEADVYLMKHVLHDWDDEACLQILQNVRRSIGQRDAQLLLVEAVLPEEPSIPQLILDMQMMVLVGGKERTQSEWAALLAAGGFQLDEVVRVPLPSNADVVVTRPQGA